MKIIDEGIIIHKSPYGESSIILTIFSKQNGLIKGLYKGALTSKNKYLLQLGNIIDFEKTYRLESQLGFLKIDLRDSYLSDIFNNSSKLLILVSMMDLIGELINENEEMNDFYLFTKDVISFFKNNYILHNYILWEIKLLEAIGYGLDLSRCCITFETNGLYYLSPKSGKSVIKSVGDPHKHKLFIIPSFFLNPSMDFQDIKKEDIINGFNITGYFLEKFMLEYNKKIPLSRKKIIYN